jgi:hypothetical protein|tara:strand:- start:502 stop:738 length:237 start_codon:yes stop_codon:yes gene_type:complete
MGNRLSNTINRQDFKNKILNTTQSNINDFKLGRWGNKTLKQREIAEYWTNIDHCGDTVCGNLKKTKKYYEAEILKIKK